MWHRRRTPGHSPMFPEWLVCSRKRGLTKTNYQEMTMKMISLALVASLLSTGAFAHRADDHNRGHHKPPPFAILQLDQVRDATARYRDVEKAEAAGYHDIGLFVPH